MLNTTFSLTEQIIIYPVLRMRAQPLADPNSPQGTDKKIWHFIESEALARITALFTSLFAACDTFVHLLAGCYKGGALCLGKYSPILISWNKAEVKTHFQEAKLFFKLTLIGSIAGTIWPGLLKNVKRSPLHFLNNKEFPKNIQQLANEVNSNKQKPPFDTLKQVWDKSNLHQKHKFVQVFSQNLPSFQSVRNNLSNSIYRSIVTDPTKQVKWLNEEDVYSNIGIYYCNETIFSQGFFFHATSKEALESILKTKRLEVRHEKTFRGAFVSTQPEFCFGNYILVFKRNIERLSPLEHGFTLNKQVYWAGFSRDIPVDEQTLAYLILRNGYSFEKRELEQNCKDWTGREIKVISQKEIECQLASIQNLGMGIPKEWPEEEEEVGQKIIHAMELAIRHQTTTVSVTKTSSKNSSDRLIA